MDAQYFLEEMIDLQKKILDYLDGAENFQEISKIIADFQDNLSMREMTPIICLIVKIANNYHRTPNFFDKIFQILIKFKTDIQQTFTNYEIFKLFKSNKRILLFSIEESLLKFDQSIIDHINENKYWDMNYIKFFLIESKPFISINLFDEIKNGLQIENDDFELFKEQRRIGENDEYIAKLIRDDSIDEFIVYMNKTNTSHSKTINHSIFETNLFLLKKNPTLIEYSAFFGSFQIFKYLQLNGVDIETSIWLYAIHGNNPEIIHTLEENEILPFAAKCSYDQINYEKCFNEAIKCHCNDIALYIQNNYLLIHQQENIFKNNFLYYKYQNYFFFDKDLSNLQQLKFFIEYHYDFLVIKVLNMNSKNINELLIHNIIFFMEFQCFYLFNDVLNNHFYF